MGAFSFAGGSTLREHMNGQEKQPRFSVGAFRSVVRREVSGRDEAVLNHFGDKRFGAVFMRGDCPDGHTLEVAVSPDNPTHPILEFLWITIERVTRITWLRFRDDQMAGLFLDVANRHGDGRKFIRW